jgi:hypothetical protein
MMPLEGQQNNSHTELWSQLTAQEDMLTLLRRPEIIFTDVKNFACRMLGGGVILKGNQCNVTENWISLILSNKLKFSLRNET